MADVVAAQRALSRARMAQKRRAMAKGYRSVSDAQLDALTAPDVLAAQVGEAEAFARSVPGAADLMEATTWET